MAQNDDPSGFLQKFEGKQMTDELRAEMKEMERKEQLKLLEYDDYDDYEHEAGIDMEGDFNGADFDLPDDMYGDGDMLKDDSFLQTGEGHDAYGEYGYDDADHGKYADYDMDRDDRLPNGEYLDDMHGDMTGMKDGDLDDLDDHSDHPQDETFLEHPQREDGVDGLGDNLDAQLDQMGENLSHDELLEMMQQQRGKGDDGQALDEVEEHGQ